MRGIQTGKEEGKVSLFEDDVILYIKTPQAPSVLTLKKHIRRFFFVTLFIPLDFQLWTSNLETTSLISLDLPSTDWSPVVKVHHHEKGQDDQLCNLEVRAYLYQGSWKIRE